MWIDQGVRNGQEFGEIIETNSESGQAEANPEKCV